MEVSTLFAIFLLKLAESVVEANKNVLCAKKKKREHVGHICIDDMQTKVSTRIFDEQKPSEKKTKNASLIQDTLHYKFGKLRSYSNDTYILNIYISCNSEVSFSILWYL